jgi:hypothetical protein
MESQLSRSESSVLATKLRKNGFVSLFLYPVIALLGVVAIVAIFSISTLPMNDNVSPVFESLSVYNERNLHVSESSVETIFSKEELIKKYFPHEEPIRNPTDIPDGYSTFSACMLVMDDNHRLTEWLAYHYHVLPLRFMIVAVDPRSETYPTHIFNQWRRRGMVIIEWGDRDFWRADLKLVAIPDDAELQTKRDRHRGRQKYFYKQCMIQLKRANRTWVTISDSDEFLVYNHAGGDKYEAWERSREAKQKNDTVIFNYKHDALNNERAKQIHKRVKPSQTPPTTAEEGAMIQYIRQEQQAGLKFYQSPCIGVPRLMFGADESNVSRKQITKKVPKFFHDKIHRFDTLRYRKHAPRNDFVKNALGKVIIDVSRVDVANAPYFMSLHRPIKSICSPPWHNDWESGLRINHYLGSWESYSFRNDARRGGERSQEQWEYKATTVGDLTDDNIRPWLDGFVKTHGTEEAQEWLEHVGLPATYHNPNDEKWRLNADRLIAILDTNETDVQDGKQVAFEDWVRVKYRNDKENLLRRAKKAVQETAEGKVAVIWGKD